MLEKNIFGGVLHVQILHYTYNTYDSYILPKTYGEQSVLKTLSQLEIFCKISLKNVLMRGKKREGWSYEFKLSPGTQCKEGSLSAQNEESNSRAFEGVCVKP